LFGIVALVVVGPNELPGALRAAGRVLARVKRLQAGVRKAAKALMADASLDREFEGLGETFRSSLALDPATAMRGSLRVSRANPAGGGIEAAALEYASPEMRAYLAPPAEAPPPADAEVAPT
jgi:sec-independent protein translocase protein TatB